MSDISDEHEDTDQKSAVPKSDEPMSIVERNRGKFDFVLLEHDVVEANTKRISQLHDDIIGYLTVGLEKLSKLANFSLSKRKESDMDILHDGPQNICHLKIPVLTLC